jgi:hypothetical protein
MVTTTVWLEARFSQIGHFFKLLTRFLLSFPQRGSRFSMWSALR